MKSTQSKIKNKIQDQIDLEALQEINNLCAELKEIDSLLQEVDAIANTVINKTADIQISISAIEKAEINNAATHNPLLFVPNYGYFEPIEVPHARSVLRTYAPESTTLVIVRAIITERTARRAEILQEITNVKIEKLINNKKQIK